MLVSSAMRKRPFENLIVWQESYALSLWVYEITKKFPSEEKFRLVDQMCRSSYSVPMNIAEGSGKKSHKERERFYETASCSLEELYCQCLFARDLKYISEKEFEKADDHMQRVSFLLMKLRAAL